MVKSDKNHTTENVNEVPINVNESPSVRVCVRVRAFVGAHGVNVGVRVTVAIDVVVSVDNAFTVGISVALSVTSTVGVCDWCDCDSVYVRPSRAITLAH